MSDRREKGDGGDGGDVLRNILAGAAVAVAGAALLGGARRLLGGRGGSGGRGAGAGGRNLQGETALVTGGSRGLGFLLAERLLEEGCRVAICARSEEDLERARDRLLERARARQRERTGPPHPERTGTPRLDEGTEPEVMTWACDVSDPEAVEVMVRAVESRFGSLDLLVNNAAVIQVAPLEALDLEDFREAMDVNFFGMVHTTLAALPGMRERGRGRIVNVTSIGGKVAVPHLLPYDSAKFAAVGFSEGLQAALAKDGIRVTTVVPGLMRTGSPARVEYGGRPEREFVWFALGDLLPFTAMSAERAARRIVEAARRGEAEVVLSWQAKLLRAAHDLAPGTTARVLGLVNRILPDGGGGGGARRAWGAELRGGLPEWAERALDRAGRRTNQGSGIRSRLPRGPSGERTPTRHPRMQ